MHWFQPETEQDVAENQPAIPPVPPPPAPQKLPALPPGSMAQRSNGHYQPLPPMTHTYRGGLVADADLFGVAGRVTASLRPAFHLDTKAPLFRDDTTWEQFEDSRLARLRWMQTLTQGQRDVHGENLGTGQGPRTLIMSTVTCERFSDGTGTIPAVKR